jgi:uncharacterized protein YggE
MKSVLRSQKSEVRSVLLFSLLLFSFLLCSAQNIENTPYIETIGYAQMEVVPNQINVQITLKEYYDGVYKITIAEQEAKMKNMLKIVGVDMTKISMGEENTEYVTVSKKSKDVITEKIYHLILSSALMFTNTFQVLNDLKIHDARVVSVSHSQMDSLRQTVKIQALQDAKAKANALVSAIGNNLGKPLIIKETEYNMYQEDLNEDIMEDEYVLEFKKIKIQNSIYTRFAIE